MPNINQFSSKKEYNKWFREYRQKNLKYFRKYNREYNKKYRKENGYYWETRWQQNNKDARLAQRLARIALKKGTIIKAACIVCKDKKAIMHHPNYKKPLAIIWLCKIHHRKVHYAGCG